MSDNALARAFFGHPAFLPHRLLRALGIPHFWAENLIVTLIFVGALTICAWLDGSDFLHKKGYGYFEHLGIFGWYVIELVMPTAIYNLMIRASKDEPQFQSLVVAGETFNFEYLILRPMRMFIALRTPFSRWLYSSLFCVGFAGFAWNTYQNLYPGTLAPLDFWDSIHFPYGYVGTRIYKFYMDALLLPSIAHIFSGIIWVNVLAVRRLVKAKNIRIAPFNIDRCGGFGFLTDLILSPAITALLVSGLAFFGDVYTHRALYISTLMGIVVLTAVLAVFYVLPTLFLRSTISELKRFEANEIYRRQEGYYQKLVVGGLEGSALRDAHEYLKYFDEVIAKIDAIPKWPHLAKISSAFGLAIIPTLISPTINLANLFLKMLPNPH
jgi:hypothetical protein